MQLMQPCNSCNPFNRVNPINPVNQPLPHGSPHPFSRLTSRVEAQKRPVFIGSSRVHGSSPPRVSPSLIILILTSTLIRRNAHICAFIHHPAGCPNYAVGPVRGPCADQACPCPNKATPPPGKTVRAAASISWAS